MPIYDIAMFVVLGAAVIFGYWKGLAWQVASLAAIVVSYIVSVKFREPVSQFIQAEAPWNRIGAMLILFLGTSLLIWTIYARIAKSLKKNELTGFDRQAGALLGAVKGGVLCMVATMFAVSLLGTKIHDDIHLSTTGKYVIKGIGAVSSIVPEELAKYVDPHVENFQNAIGQSPMAEQFPNNTYPTPNQVQTPTQNPPQNQTPYSGQFQWQTPTTQAGYGTNTGQPNGSPNQNYGNQPFGGNVQNAGGNFGNQAGYSGQTQWQTPTTNQPNNSQWNYSQNGNGAAGTYGNNPNTNGGNPQINWPNIDMSDASRRVIDAAIQHGADAARRAINPGNPQR